ncbi:MAG: DNA glycosylase AlkZ-like family protein [Thermoplasmata archaeon]
MRRCSLEVARRFVLGRQGLWPGRRWGGPGAVDRTIRYVGSVQYDPLDVVGRNADLALWGRIDDYRPEDLENALYRRRSLFESAGNVQIRPVGEIPYLRVAMQRSVGAKRWHAFVRQHGATVRRVRRELARRGPLGPGDFREAGREPIQNYRAGTVEGLALYHLWLKGDVLVAFRRRGEKVFDLAERLLPTTLADVPAADAEEHLILGTLRELGLPTASDWLAHAHTRIGRSTLRWEWTRRLRAWRDAGRIREVEVEGKRGPRWLVVEAELESLIAGDVPPAWKPRSTTTEEEAVLLAPLDRVSARGRASDLFDFEYLWEVYKPESARRWGYYTLPVLFGDRLRARIELRHDRPQNEVRAIGFWPEESSLRRDPRFADALGRALGRLAAFRGGARVGSLRALGSRSFAQRVTDAAARSSIARDA